MQKTRILFIHASIALLMIACLGSTLPASSTEAPGAEPVGATAFHTPEEAVTHYLEGVAMADINYILQACAVDEMAEGFKFDQNAERLGVFMPLNSLSPANHPFFVEINKTQVASQILNQIKILTYSLLSEEDIEEPVIQLDAERINAFVTATDPGRLAQLEIVKIGIPNPTRMEDARYKENSAALAGIYGADESTERVALFTFEGDYYYSGFTLLRYGESWKINSQTSPLAKTPAVGIPQRTTVEEFDSLISGGK